MENRNWKLSERQAYLLELSDTEIRASTAVFSFEFSEFTARVTSGEQWVQLITAHLYLDHILTFMLSEGLVVPTAIETTRLSFSQRLQMCAALGLLPDDQARAIDKVNNLRNRLAHSLIFSVETKDILDLTNSTPKRIRDALKATKGRRRGPLHLSELLIGIVLSAELSRQSNAENRSLQQKAAAKLTKALIDAQPTLDGIYAASKAYTKPVEN